MSKLKHKTSEIIVLLRSIPSPIVTVFAVSVIMMNLLANKSISLAVDWLALDCGIIISWVSFLSMDIVTKHFGPKAATELSLFAVFVNLLCCAVFFLAGTIPGMWGESFVAGSEHVINTALDNTVSGTWYVLFGSTAAFITSAVINNFLNAFIGKMCKKQDGFGTYALRTYLSTAVGQFCDNMVFALIVSHSFFGWSLLQCVTCSVTGMVVELLFEVVFSPIGYRVCKKWKANGIGSSYFAFLAEHKPSARGT
ncbi:MAG: VUT family protein [Clostridia bacterium]|nr:VUT family protein [Clostridia bacterium]